MANELLVEFCVPFEQSAQVDGEFLIDGIAINETTTSNGHVFLGEELAKAAPSLNGVPLLKDHTNSVDSIVGRVKSAHFDEMLRAIPFKALVADQDMQSKIKSGLINSVSVGAHVDPKNIEELENGDIVPRGIVFKELSLVAVPADAGATFGVALRNAYNGFKSDLKTDERGSMMTMSEEEVTKETPEEVVEEPKVEAEEVKAEPVEDVAERFNILEAKIDKLLESDEDEVAAEPEPEAKAEEEEEADEVEEKDKAYTLTEGNKSISLERTSYM